MKCADQKRICSFYYLLRKIRHKRIMNMHDIKPFPPQYLLYPLFKQGINISLQQQPFRVLALLLEHPGEVVTREDLRQAIWPAGTFVEFDVGLDAAIHKLRSALGDSAENPQVVEPLPRREEVGR